MVENDESGGNQDNWVPILCGINISRPWLVLGTKTPWLGLGKYYDTCSNEFEASNWDIMNWLVASQRLYPSFLQPKFRFGGEWWKWWQKSNSGLLYKRMMVWVLCAIDTETVSFQGCFNDKFNNCPSNFGQYQLKFAYNKFLPVSLKRQICTGSAIPEVASRFSLDVLYLMLWI